MSSKSKEKKAARALQATTGWSYQACINHLRKKTSVTKETSKETCVYCGTALSAEAVELRRKHGPLTCPECSREGCYECMPAGRGCICPECEGKAA